MFMYNYFTEKNWGKYTLNKKKYEKINYQLCVEIQIIAKQNFTLIVYDVCE